MASQRSETCCQTEGMKTPGSRVGGGGSGAGAQAATTVDAVVDGRAVKRSTRIAGDRVVFRAPAFPAPGRVVALETVQPGGIGPGQFDVDFLVIDAETEEPGRSACRPRTG